MQATQARVKGTRFRLEQTQIIAPDDGIITDRQATLGKVVSPGDILFRLHRQNRLEWRAQLSSNELSFIRTGQSVEITLPGSSVISGTVRKIAPTIDPHNRNGLVYVDLKSTEFTRTGTFATGQILLEKIQVLAIPQTAISFREGFAWVFLVDKEGRVRQHQVTTAEQRNGWVVITDGISQHDHIVAGGVTFLSEGDRVRVIKATHEETTSDTSSSSAVNGGRS